MSGSLVRTGQQVPEETVGMGSILGGRAGEMLQE